MSGERVARAGLDLEEGDTISAGAGAWALLAMSDGAILTVRPGTRMRIETYRHVPDGAVTRNRSAITLMQGALRIITGLIGQINRQGYSVITPTATVGIRGTDHEPAYHAAGHAEGADVPAGTYDKVNAGETFIRNARGVVSVRAGQVAFAHDDARVAPQPLARPPEFFRRHAEIDQRAAPRRAEIQRRIERERQQRQIKPDQTKDGKRDQKLQDPRSSETDRQRARDAREEEQRARDSEAKPRQQRRDERPSEAGERTQRDRDTADTGKVDRDTRLERGRDVDGRSSDGSQRGDVRRDGGRHGTR